MSSGAALLTAQRSVISRVLATSMKPLTSASSCTMLSASSGAGRFPDALMSSSFSRDESTSGVAAVTQSRRKSGRALPRSRCFVSSSVSCSTMHRLVPGLARSRICGLSTKVVCVLSPPALESSHWPTVAAPHILNESEPATEALTWPWRIIEAERARPSAASISKRIELNLGCCSSIPMDCGASETRLTSARPASSVMAESCIWAKRSCE
mmetsp:Transcript_51384/g.111800  ORF Transcript_51384/g.111800 Transcript_51384/m.111800 type:complete len:211 (-) Transcript_51384:3182-3814(-)